MNNLFNIPVLNNGKVLIFTAKLFIVGFAYKFEVDVDGTDVLFEPNEKDIYHFAHYNTGREIADAYLLKKIAQTIECIVA